MKIKKKVEIRSPDAKWILEKKLNTNASMVTIAIIKVSKIYELVGNQYLYAYIVLSNLLEKIYKAKTKMLKLVGDFEKLILDNKIDLKSFDIDVLNTYEMHASDPVTVELISMLEIYDRLSCLLIIANRLNVFKKGRHKFFRAVSNNRGRMYTIFLEILNIDLVKLPPVSIMQYLNNEDAYKEASKTMGKVKPAVFFAAFDLDMFPRLPATERNTIIHKLKHME